VDGAPDKEQQRQRAKPDIPAPVAPERDQVQAPADQRQQHHEQAGKHHLNRVEVTRPEEGPEGILHRRGNDPADALRDLETSLVKLPQRAGILVV